ncbi:MAG: hypothetical protein KDF59_11040 [Nitrosomonas sp.]|nr:hypothetical protein [Nitrosomonas sp.]
MNIAGFSEFVSVHGKACLTGKNRSIAQRHNGTTLSMGADRLTTGRYPVIDCGTSRTE